MSNINQVASTVTQQTVPVQAQFNAAGECLGLVGPGGVFFSPPISNSAINDSSIGLTTPSTGNFTSLSLNGDLFASTAVLPVVSAGFGTNPVVTALSTFAFRVVVGTGGAASGTITLPAAGTGWMGFAADVTSGNTIFLQLTASTSTTLTFTSYSVTSGLAVDMAAGDVILINAIAY
jgi:hypothetical protein